MICTVEHSNNNEKKKTWTLSDVHNESRTGAEYTPGEEKNVMTTYYTPMPWMRERGIQCFVIGEYTILVLVSVVLAVTEHYKVVPHATAAKEREV